MFETKRGRNSKGDPLPLRFHPLIIAFFMSDAFNDITLVREILGFKCRCIFGEQDWWSVIDS